MDANGYRVVIEPLSDEDGGGFLATVPELPGCMSDGDSRQEALANVEDAIAIWIACAPLQSIRLCEILAAERS